MISHICGRGREGWRRPTAGPGCWGSLRRICVFLFQSCEKITRALWHSPLWLLQKHRRCSTEAITTLKSITEATRRMRQNSFLPKVNVRLRGCTKHLSQHVHANLNEPKRRCKDERAPHRRGRLQRHSLLPLAEASGLVWAIASHTPCCSSDAVFESFPFLWRPDL